MCLLDPLHFSRYQCLTNSYGPTSSNYEFCKGKCHKTVTSDIRVRLNGPRLTQRRRSALVEGYAPRR